MTVENRKELMDRISLTEGYKERIADGVNQGFTGRTPNVVTGKIWQRRGKMLAAAASICICFGIMLGNKTVQAKLSDWFDAVSSRADTDYKESVAYYEKEVNLKATVDGRTLNIYKLAQTSSMLIVEYELVDENGEVIPTMLWEGNLPMGATQTENVSGSSLQLPDNEENGHQRAVVYYNAEGPFDFTTMAGKKQTALFLAYVPGATYEIFGDVEPCWFTIDFVLEDIFPRVSYEVGEKLYVGDYYICVDEIYDEGIFTVMSFTQTSDTLFEKEGGLGIVMEDENGEVNLANSHHFVDTSEEFGKGYLYFEHRDITQGEYTLTATFTEWGNGNVTYGDKMILNIGDQG